MGAPIQTQFPELRQDQLDDKDPEAVKDHLLNTINPVIRGVSQALASGVNGQKQLDADVLTFKIVMPASDWTEIAAASPWVNFDASPTPSGQAAHLAYRKDTNGTVWWRGLIKSGTAFGNLVTPLPTWLAPAYTWRPLVWGSRGGVLGSFRLDVNPISISSAMTVADGTVNAGTWDFLIMDFAYPSASSDPEPHPPFPVSVIVKKNRVPYRVDVCQVLDTSAIPRGQVQRQHAIPYTNPSAPGWRYLGEGNDGLNRISIDSIAGLALGRTYNVTIQVWYAP